MMQHGRGSKVISDDLVLESTGILDCSKTPSLLPFLDCCDPMLEDVEQ
jgi:hypothetical protein